MRRTHLLAVALVGAAVAVTLAGCGKKPISTFATASSVPGPLPGITASTPPTTPAVPPKTVKDQPDCQAFAKFDFVLTALHFLPLEAPAEITRKKDDALNKLDNLAGSFKQLAPTYGADIDVQVTMVKKFVAQGGSLDANDTATNQKAFDSTAKWFKATCE